LPRDAGSNNGNMDSGREVDSGNPFQRDAGRDSGPVSQDAGPPDPPFDPGPAPENWACAKKLWNDGYCDCGCGAVDSDCVGQSCSEPDCIAQGCDACYTTAYAWKRCEPPLDPGAWTCGDVAQNDSLCDCGCGIPDGACRGSGCTTPGCARDACEVRHAANGDELQPQQPPMTWTCPKAAWGGDNGCDCGCGEPDPDCASSNACTAALCNNTECSICHDSSGRTVPCADALANKTWKCDPLRYGSGDGCDCGCGVPDPDCAADGCSDYGCRQAQCKRCTDMDPLYGDARLVGCGSLPEWTCNLSHYGTNDGCDCGCGVPDPDCGANGCTDKGCLETDQCDYCHRAATLPDGGVPASDDFREYKACNGWTCGDESAAAWANAECDCGCGKPDPFCRQADRKSCSESGCQTATCDYCNQSGSARAECTGDRWATSGSCKRIHYGLDGKCDCGCGAIDPDCGAGEGCKDVLCAAEGCDVCHVGSTRLGTCATWTCAKEAYGDGKCDCGCGAPDSDCPFAGCTEPGCYAEACQPDGCHDPFGRQITCQN
jgi:hypothetical protein